MTVFHDYAHYYDLLYRDKDYEAECKFIDRLINNHAPGSKTVLDLGCGTGRHAEILTCLGYSLNAVDFSADMLAVAEANRKQMNPDMRNRLQYSHGDIRSVRLMKKFDVVISLFHVISYQTSNNDLRNTFATAVAHLNQGGIFIFDCWYGPAVLTDLPVVRVKRLKDDLIEITRIAEPIMYPNENCVDVKYELLVSNHKTGKSSKYSEVHKMRYLFMPEIREYMAINSMDHLFFCEWMTERIPGINTWNVCFGGRRINL